MPQALNNKEVLSNLSPKNHEILNNRQWYIGQWSGSSLMTDNV